MRPLEAVAVVPAPPAAVFGFLSELENHWKVADRFVDVLSLDGSGGVVRVSGPLGLRRTALTRVTAIEPPDRMEGTAEMGRHTRARVSWTLTGRGDSTLVRLAATVERSSALDRLLLTLGGRAWLERRFASAVAKLALSFEERAAPARSRAPRLGAARSG